MKKRVLGILVLTGLVWICPTSVLQAAAADPGAEPAREPAYRLFLNVKGAWHTLWKAGLFEHSADYGRPTLGANDMQGIGGEAEVELLLKRYFLVSATLGAYEGSASKFDVSLISGYGLITAKLQNPGELADYYVGLGLGGYLTRLSADGTATALQPGAHAVAGIRIHLAPSWSLLVEDRLAFTLRAKGGFGNVDLGGNFALLGCSYCF